MATSSSNLNILMDDFATLTIPTTGTTRSSAKRVRITLFTTPLLSTWPTIPATPTPSSSLDTQKLTKFDFLMLFVCRQPVWVGSLVVKELKRIVEQSEIIK